MNKLPKALKKELEELASSLPVDFYVATTLSTIKGEDIDKTGLESDELIDPDKEYQFKSPVYHAKNHYRRMRRIFEDNGQQGVMQYVDEVMERYKAGLN